MRYPVDAIPADVDLNGLAVAHNSVPRGFDFSQVFEGLPNNLCPCPHWGYLVKGWMIVKYEDGSEEEIRGGDVYYLRAGHTAVAKEDTVSIDFSPIGPWRQLTQHVATRRQAR